MISPRSIQPRVIRYIFSGILSFCVENASFLIFFYLLDFKVAVANVASICIALVINFFISKYYVFRDAKSPVKTSRQFLAYLVLVAFNLGASTLLVTLLVNAGAAGYAVKPCVTLMVAAWTYFAYKRIIFKDTQV